MFVPPQIRVALKCVVVQRRHPLVVQRPHRLHHDVREFSQSSIRHATEDRDSILSQLQSSPIMRQIADKPEVLKALQDFALILKESNVEISQDKPPSTLQMFKLAANPKFRDGARRVIDEMRNAGINITSDNAFELFGMKPPNPGK